MNKKIFKHIFVVLAVLLIASTTGTAKEKYGGIPSSVNITPNDTIINKELSEYYNKPVATGDGNTYWFIGGYGWFNQEEMMNLPSKSIMNDISPYDCESDGCGSTNESRIPVPISVIVIAAFIGIVYLVNKKRTNK